MVFDWREIDFTNLGRFVKVFMSARGWDCGIKKSHYLHAKNPRRSQNDNECMFETNCKLTKPITLTSATVYFTQHEYL